LCINVRLASRNYLEDLTPTQFALLDALYQSGTLPQNQISAKLFKSAGNITAIVDQLEKLGWVRREQGIEDRRLSLVSLTPHGKTAVERMLSGYKAALLAEMQVLTEEEQLLLGCLCGKLRKMENCNP